MQINQGTTGVRLLVLYLFTFSYAGALNHYTVEPINNIEANKHNEVRLPFLIYDSKIRKE